MRLGGARPCNCAGASSAWSMLGVASHASTSRRQSASPSARAMPEIRPRVCWASSGAGTNDTRRSEEGMSSVWMFPINWLNMARLST